MKRRMKKRMIMGSLMLCCMILVTAIGSAFSRKLGDEKENVFLASEHYNMKIHDKKTEFKHTKPYTGLDYKNENLNGKSSDHLQALIMAPILIVKAIEENPVIVSRQ